MIQLNYRDSRPIYEQIKDGFRKLVISGSLEAHEQLPSVREMAAGLAINPNTIQRAYHELESEGYVYTIAGKGTFVAENQNLHEMRQRDLMIQFDEVVTELFFLSVKKDALLGRVNELAKGGKTSDSSSELVKNI